MINYSILRIACRENMFSKLTAGSVNVNKSPETAQCTFKLLYYQHIKCNL